uniref:Uncharacterized protein n=1 Tax=Amphimedon queenslandica TaxID=400682 RepID=A0A1X7TRV2_AMPQE
MSVRQPRKKITDVIKPTVYLVYFKDDKTVSISDARDIVEDCSGLEVGSLCHVKVRTKIFQATVVTYSSIEEVRNVEEQFVNKIYNPEFIVEADDDDGTERSGISNNKNDQALMNNVNSSDLENNTVVMKTATHTCLAMKRKSIDKQQGKQSKKSRSAKPKDSVNKIKKKELKEQKSSVTVVAVSSNSQSDSSTASFGLPSETKTAVSSAALSDPRPVTCVSKSADAIATSKPRTVSNLSVSSSSSSGLESPPPLPQPIGSNDLGDYPE